MRQICRSVVYPDISKMNVRRMPYWGKTEDYEINFEWPTKEQISEMPEDVRLERLDLKRADAYYGLASI